MEDAAETSSDKAELETAELETNMSLAQEAVNPTHRFLLQPPAIFTAPLRLFLVDQVSFHLSLHRGSFLRLLIPMDPLSVGASIVGLLAAGAQVTSLISPLISSSKESPALAQRICVEVTDITVALGPLQNLISGRAQVATGRGELILLDHLLITLTGCVTTYSELQFVLNTLNLAGDMGTFDRIRWMKQESRLNGLVQRLQSHKLSLVLMLTTMQCQSKTEARSSNSKLHGLIEQILESNRDLAERIQGLEGEGSVISKARSEILASDDMTTIRPGSVSGSVLMTPKEEPEETLVKRFAFEDDLVSSRVYNRAIYRHSQLSLTSSALYTTALSVFSKLSLSQVSGISFYALPVCAIDLSNSECYIFGDEGARVDPTTDISPPHRPNTWTKKMEKLLPPVPHEPEPETVAPALNFLSVGPKPVRRGLLGRFAVPQRRLPVSLPTNPMHVTHVGYDNSIGKFTGVPTEWKKILGYQEKASNPPAQV